MEEPIDALPVTINKTWLGQVGIALGGILTIVLLTYGFYNWAFLPGINQEAVAWLGIFVVVLVAAFTVIWLRVYSLSYITLTVAGVQAVYWATLFNRQVIDTEWSDIEDVSAVTSGIFAQLLNFGTVNIQTAGTLQNIRMVMIPNAEHWRVVINHYQDQSTPNEALTQ